MSEIITEQKLSQLIDIYGDLVYSICYKITGHYFDSQDLTQDTFLTVYNKYDSFDGRNEKAWICKIATNKAIDYLKKSKPILSPIDSVFFSSLKSSSKSPEEKILENALREILYCICCKLKKPYDKVALDYFYYELTVSEMAQTSGKKIKTLQTQVYRARIMLRQMWRKEFYDENK